MASDLSMEISRRDPLNAAIFVVIWRVVLRVTWYMVLDSCLALCHAL